MQHGVYTLVAQTSTPSPLTLTSLVMSDTEKQIKKKINSHAFSGGQETLELHRELGGNPDIDVPYQYLAYFEDDDEKLAKFAEDYRKGDMLTGDMKRECITMMTAYVKKFQDAREKVTDEILDEFLRPRQLEWKGNPNPTKPKIVEDEKKEGQTGGPAATTVIGPDGQPMTKNQLKKLQKQQETERKKAEKAAAKKQ